MYFTFRIWTKLKINHISFFLQIFQIMYVIVKAANSPRPGTWVLERSMDGENYQPWQYYAISDQECMDRFGIEATPGKPRFKSATDVICTSYYSKLLPLENGEVCNALLFVFVTLQIKYIKFLNHTIIKELMFVKPPNLVATKTPPFHLPRNKNLFQFAESPRLQT